MKLNVLMSGLIGIITGTGWAIIGFMAYLSAATLSPAGIETALWLAGGAMIGMLLHPVFATPPSIARAPIVVTGSLAFLASGFLTVFVTGRIGGF